MLDDGTEPLEGAAIAGVLELGLDAVRRRAAQDLGAAFGAGAGVDAGSDDGAGAGADSAAGAGSGDVAVGEAVSSAGGDGILSIGVASTVG